MLLRNLYTSSSIVPVLLYGLSHPRVRVFLYCSVFLYNQGSTTAGEGGANTGVAITRRLLLR